MILGKRLQSYVLIHCITHKNQHSQNPSLLRIMTTNIYRHLKCFCSHLRWCKLDFPRLWYLDERCVVCDCISSESNLIQNFKAVNKQYPGSHSILNSIVGVVLLENMTSCHSTMPISKKYKSTCEISQVLLAGVPGVFSLGSPVFDHLLIGPSHMS